MDRTGTDVLITKTSLLIAPGYRFRIVTSLITNFHQPRSTLLLLVAAFIGDNWKSVYAYALENDFRFLSYGDSCLFFRQ
jgi:S-adenosylmethionine:tRNA ribosyltransferase-isomerase